jgi:TldD protein
MHELLEELLGEFSGVDYGELRYHERKGVNIAVRQGELEAANSTVYSGIGARAFHKGGWGFSSTSRLGQGQHQQDDSRRDQRSQGISEERVTDLAEAELAKGRVRSRDRRSAQ